MKWKKGLLANHPWTREGEGEDQVMCANVQNGGGTTSMVGEGTGKKAQVSRGGKARNLDWRFNKGSQPEGG